MAFGETFSPDNQIYLYMNYFRVIIIIIIILLLKKGEIIAKYKYKVNIIAYFENNLCDEYN